MGPACSTVASLAGRDNTGWWLCPRLTGRAWSKEGACCSCHRREEGWSSWVTASTGAWALQRQPNAWPGCLFQALRPGAARLGSAVCRLFSLSSHSAALLCFSASGVSSVGICTLSPHVSGSSYVCLLLSRPVSLSLTFFLPLCISQPLSTLSLCQRGGERRNPRQNRPGILL